MNSIQPYLWYKGNCEEAMNFYKAALGATEVFSMRYSDGPDEFKRDDWNDKIMHCTMQVADGVTFMMADTWADYDGNYGNMVTLSLNFDSAEEQTEVFNKLTEGGKVSMPLENTFWGARFGMATDKFGIQWMFNYDLPREG